MQNLRVFQEIVTSFSIFATALVLTMKRNIFTVEMFEAKK